MGVNGFTKIVILASLIVLTSASTCEVMNHTTNCNYVVKCYRVTGSVSNPECDTEPYVTFIISSSRLDHLSPGYFAATNFDSRVREIKSENNIWGAIENSAFRYYTKCVRVDLSVSGITKIKSEAFRNMGEMRFLNLSGNYIQSFYSDSFSISEGKHNNLMELDLSNNGLHYLGSELNELPNLKILYLQNNKLSSVADDAFMNLKDLSHLYMQHNLVTSVNLSLIHLKSLESFDISNNLLITLSGYEMNRLVALVELNVSHNEITLVESNCFNQAVNLEKADFSFNNIKITIDDSMFRNNIKLKYLDFQTNKIVGIQANAFQYCNLSYLNLVNNNFTGDITEKTFLNSGNFTVLDLSRQGVTSLRNNAFTNLRNLLSLNLSRNNINLVENNTFLNTSLIVLDLSHNKIPDLYFLKKSLSNLTELYLNNNNITTLPKYIFEHQSHIKKLDMSMNSIITIEEYSLPLQNIQYLNIVGNRINGVIKKNIFSPAKYLRFLDLSYFNISKIDSSAFAELPVLAKLNLSNNNIEKIEDGSFNGVDNLYSLDISYNKLSEFKLNSTIMPNLKALHFRNNKLTNISALFSGVCKLTYLDLSFNQIQNLSGIGSNILPNLTVLFLDNNNLSQFNNREVNSLTTLIDISLSSNNISNIKLGHFPELMSVDLSNNNICYLNRTFLEKNEYLQALDVSRNRIADLPPGTFLSMKNLKLLNLSSNYLSRLRYGSLKGLHKTEILDLSRNNIAQLDVDIFHECDELKTLIIDYNRIKTFDVERLIIVALRKLRTLSLGGNPILCREIVHNIKSANTTFYAIRQVEVTSIHKIYHEDNVHGIKCGDDNVSVSFTTRMPYSTESMSSIKDESSLTSTTIVLIWCSVLTIVLITGSVLAYVKLYKKRVLVVNSTNLQLRNSIDLTGSDFQSDLLG